MTANQRTDPMTQEQYHEELLQTIEKMAETIKRGAEEMHRLGTLVVDLSKRVQWLEVNSRPRQVL